MRYFQEMDNEKYPMYLDISTLRESPFRILNIVLLCLRVIVTKGKYFTIVDTLHVRIESAHTLSIMK
jgi:hypothetical protein